MGFQTNGKEKAHVSKSKSKWNKNGDNSEHEEELEPEYVSHTPKSQSKKHMKKIESYDEDEVEQDNSYKTPKSQAKMYSYKTHSDEENNEKNITRTPKSQSKRIIMKKAESEEDEYDGDKNKSKSKTPKSQLKKNKLNIEKDIGRQESDEDLTELISTKKYQKKKSLTPSTCKFKNTNIDTAEEEKARDSDDSFDLDVSSRKKKISPNKKALKEQDSDDEVDVPRKTPLKSKKKDEKKKDELMTPVGDIGEPRSARKRKIPSYLKEFDVEDTKESSDKQDKTCLDPETPKQPKAAKRRKLEDTDEEDLYHEPEVYKRKKEDMEPKTPKRKKVNPLTPKSSQKKKVAITSEFGECVLCGLMFDEESNKFAMTDKTRETGQTFADLLFGLLHEETLPPSLVEHAKAVDLDSGNICTLCVSHVDQLDVFQQKVTDIKTSIISIFIQKTRNESLNHGDTDPAESHDEIGFKPTKLIPTPKKETPKKETPKKKGKKEKIGKIVTLVYQSPLKRVKDLETMSDKEISKMTETIIKYTPRQAKNNKTVKDDDIETEKENSKPDSELAEKLSVLSGIEIKKINKDDGDESLQIS